jgi:hypothetical protein
MLRAMPSIIGSQNKKSNNEKYFKHKRSERLKTVTTPYIIKYFLRWGATSDQRNKRYTKQHTCMAPVMGRKSKPP